MVCWFRPGVAGAGTMYVEIVMGLIGRVGKRVWSARIRRITAAVRSLSSRVPMAAAHQANHVHQLYLCC